MELVTHKIPIKSGQEILLMPIGDIQWVGDESEVALSMLKRHVDWGVEHGAYFLGMGDYIDTFSPSNRQRLKSAVLYDSAIKGLDVMAENLIDELYDRVLKPTKGRWLGLLEGHHYHEFRDGTTSDQRLAGLLDTRFLGTCAFVRLLLVRGRASRQSTVIWCHHGAGGGARIGSPLNKLDQLVIGWDADIYLIGHMTKKVAAPLDRVEVYWQGHEPRLLHRTKIIACTGGFMKGYVPGRRDGGPKSTPRGGYVEQKMLPPTALGGILVKIRVTRKCLAGGEFSKVDLNVEL